MYSSSGMIKNMLWFSRSYREARLRCRCVFSLIRLLTYRLLSISTVSREFGKISLEKNRNKFYLFLWIHYVQYIGIVQLTSNPYIFSFIYKWYVKNGFSSGIVRQFCMSFNLIFLQNKTYFNFTLQCLWNTQVQDTVYIRN